MARTILLFHTISVRPSKQPQIMEYVPSPKVFDGLILEKNNKQHDHHQHRPKPGADCTGEAHAWGRLTMPCIQ